MRSEVNVKVKMTTKWYSPLRHRKTNPHTKFRITTLYNIEDMLLTRVFKKQGQGQSDPKTGT